MKPTSLLAAFALTALVGVAGAAGSGAARGYDDFGVGRNAEAQDCRALWRFEDARAPRAVDLYCGKWERPAGWVRLVPAAQALAALKVDCPGDPRAVADGVYQAACAPGAAGIRRYGLVIVHGPRAAIGSAYPSDWAPLTAAARVALGLERPGAAPADPPGGRQLAALYPAGLPGQGAAFNYELLRRRAYEQNYAWSFGASERDFAELLRAHERLAPDDAEGEAEILAEVGLNLSNARRFSEAEDLFDRAEAQAKAARADLLVTKIGNYRAMDRLNQGRPAEAQALALAANAERARLGLAPSPRSSGVIIPPSQSRWTAGVSGRLGRGLVGSLDEITPQERAEVLSAQGAYLAASAARAQKKPEASALLDQALSHLARSSVQPGWLAGLIYEERSGLRRAARDYPGAAAEARKGLHRVRELAPGTRAEARLLMAEAAALRDGGDEAGALRSGRAAILILRRQSEAPGMPADLAAVHLQTLYGVWSRTQDPAIADEYFQTLSLVWSGAASRAAAQLAARLGDGSEAVRAFQDAERGYRAALARRERLSVASDATAALRADADKAATDAAEALAAAEQRLRQEQPRYLELLNPEVTSAQLRAALAPGEAYVRIALARGGGWGVVVTAEGVTPYRVGLTQAEGDALAGKLRASATLNRRRLPDYDLQSAHALYQGLFGPVAAEVAAHPTLHLDVGGALAAAPLSALVVTAPTPEQLKAVKRDQDYSEVDWLARHNAVDVALGPAAFIRTRAAAQPAGQPLTLAAYGDFRPNPTLAAQRIAQARGFTDRCRLEIEKSLAALPALPGTAEEAQGSAALFGPRGRALTGAGFTDAAFLGSRQAAEAGVLVLATHGVLGLSDCFPEPALLASVGPEGDGLIEASELLDHALNARLVILSACDTAGGQVIDVGRTGLIDGGEALSGLARAFIYSGAGSVLATNWKVDAAASSLQTRALLQGLAGGRTTVAQALAGSQKLLYSQAETAHPFYWAGFQLIGDGGVRL